ncbi:unnamed protein product [Ascophyllum nodosum]
MSLEGEKKRLAMAGASGAIEEAYRQGLAAHTNRHNKVQDSLECMDLRFRETAHKATHRRPPVEDGDTAVESGRSHGPVGILRGESRDDMLANQEHHVRARVQGARQSSSHLQAYSDFLEQELLDLFERAAGRSPPEVELMRECSDILFALNEGDHLQSRFVFYVVTQVIVISSNIKK